MWQYKNYTQELLDWQYDNWYTIDEWAGRVLTNLGVEAKAIGAERKKPRGYKDVKFWVQKSCIQGPKNKMKNNLFNEKQKTAHN